MNQLRSRLIALLLAMMLVVLTGCGLDTEDTSSAATDSTAAIQIGDFDYDKIPDYEDSPYVVLNDNVPYFTENEITTDSYESYGELDSLGRCTTAMACLGQDLMPTHERESISEIHPTGWQYSPYDFIEGESLYNRCHLIAFSLADESANEKNLITGTRYLNATGMLPFEEETVAYIKDTDNHVMYRVTPVFVDDELVARGVLMEACFVEDEGDGIQFCVFCYNVQPDVYIDYNDGYNCLASEYEAGDQTYVLNTYRKKFHNPDCESVQEMNQNNKETYVGSRDDLLAEGYVACNSCDP